MWNLKKPLFLFLFRVLKLSTYADSLRTLDGVGLGVSCVMDQYT